MDQDKVMIAFQGDRSRPPRPVSSLHILKWGLRALAALSLLIAFLLAAFVIGLLLALPLIVLGIVWLIIMAARSKIRGRRGVR
jgi:Flp pilus assembly protein TadB